MKKKLTRGGICSPSLRHLILTMKLTAFIFFFVIYQSMASSLLALGKFSLECKNTTVEQILLKLEKQSKLGFIYNKDLVDVGMKRDIDVQEVTVDEILKLLFPNDNVTFYRVNNQIVISPKFIVNQQQKSVSGKVTDSNGQPLPGVTVVLKGTTQGTVTNADGEYSLASISEEDILQFSFVGMKTQEIPVGNRGYH